MGRVFSFEEVEGKRYPTPQHFERVIRMLRDELLHVKGVQSGLLIGSALWGRQNARSDVDCVVLYEEACVEDALLGLNRGLPFYLPIFMEAVKIKTNS